MLMMMMMMMRRNACSDNKGAYTQFELKFKE